MWCVHVGVCVSVYVHVCGELGQWLLYAGDRKEGKEGLGGRAEREGGDAAVIRGGTLSPPPTSCPLAWLWAERSRGEY